LPDFKQEVTVVPDLVWTLQWREKSVPLPRIDTKEHKAQSSGNMHDFYEMLPSN
jgi:hypothetical protein